MGRKGYRSTYTYIHLYWFERMTGRERQACGRGGGEGGKAVRSSDG